MTDAELVSENLLFKGMTRQLQSWRDVLGAGHQRLGWKIGFNTRADQQRMGLAKPAVGFLSSDRQLFSSDTYQLKTNRRILLEAELAILVGRDIAPGADLNTVIASIEAFAPALEIVDVTNAPTEMGDILSANLFHDSVIIGEKYYDFGNLQPTDINASVKINNEIAAESDAARYPESFIEFVAVVADTLQQHDEILRAGDWIITGSLIKPFAIEAGQQVKLDMTPLGQLSLAIA